MVTNAIQPAFQPGERFQTKLGIAFIESFSVSGEKIVYVFTHDWYAPAVYDTITEANIQKALEEKSWKKL